MPRNIRAYFYGKSECERYRIAIIASQTHVPWTDVECGETPFVVTYDTQETPFEPLMKSHATIQLLGESGDHFEDLFAQNSFTTMVYLYRIYPPEYEGDPETEVCQWAGYLNNNLMNQPQDGCSNIVELNADDAISVLEFADYKTDVKQIVTFTELLKKIFGNTPIIDEIIYDQTMKDGSTYITPAQLKMSEKNFFSSDTDEPWKCQEVLEEMCRWLCMTAIQKGSTIYIYDRQAKASLTMGSNHDVHSGWMCYRSVAPFTTWSPTTYYTDNFVFRQEMVGGSGSDISMDTIYNKVTVKDSFYEIEEFVPDLFDDDKLTNYDGDPWKSVNLPARSPYKPHWVNKNNHQKEDADDSLNDYYQKSWWHENYTPHRYAKHSNYIEPATYANMIVRLTGTSYEGPFPAMTSFTATYSLYNRSNKAVTRRVQMVEHYGSGYEGGTYYYDNEPYVDVSLDPWETKSVDIVFTTFRQTTVNFSPRFRAGNGSWVVMGNEGTEYGRPTYCQVTSEIVDLACVPKAKDAPFYNRQIANSISWDRYLCIAQLDAPVEVVSPRILSRVDALHTYPSVMDLNRGYKNPMIIDDKAFLAINGSAKIERYKYREYINPEWTGESTGIGGSYNCSYNGIITGSSEIWTYPQCLWFKLKIGSYYWNGTQWTTDESIFFVDVATDTDEDGYIDFSKLWNADKEIINNISYTDYSGAKGYKIPLMDGVNLDFNADIEFEIRLPSRVQQYSGSGGANEGMNSYVFVKDLSIKLFTKGSENYELSDVVYENVMMEDSTNEIGDITLRFTTYPGEGQHSYSSVGYDGGLANAFEKAGLDGNSDIMERNIVKCYYSQYHGNTHSQTIITDMRNDVLSRIKDSIDNRCYHTVGLSTNYREGTQTVNLIESKQYSE